MQPQENNYSLERDWISNEVAGIKTQASSWTSVNDEERISGSKQINVYEKQKSLKCKRITRAGLVPIGLLN